LLFNVIICDQQSIRRIFKIFSNIRLFIYFYCCIAIYL